MGVLNQVAICPSPNVYEITTLETFGT